RVVREAKALVPSAWDWVHGNTAARSRVKALANGAHRSPDPYLDVRDGFIFRRVAADSEKVEFGNHEQLKLHRKLLRAMGFDLGAVHAASDAVPAIREALEELPPEQLKEAAKKAADWVKDDFHDWKKHMR